MERTKPRLNTPPGSLLHSSFSRASRKREPMRVAAVISSSVTSRSSRSRFRRSPKFPLAMLCPCRGECNSDGRLDQSAESATAPRFRENGKGGRRGQEKRSGDAASLGLTIGGVKGSVKRGGAGKRGAGRVSGSYGEWVLRSEQDSLSDERVCKQCVDAGVRREERALVDG